MKGNRVFANRNFLADDEWLSGLTITIKNRSNKTILFATIQLQFPKSSGSDSRVALDQIFYGSYELLTRPPAAGESYSEIAPGDTKEVKFTYDNVERLRVLLAGNGYALSPKRLDLRIGKVIFSDGTMWYSGSLFRRDVNVPSRWVVIEPINSPESLFLHDSRSTLFGDNVGVGSDFSRSSGGNLFWKVSYTPASPIGVQSGCKKKATTLAHDCGVPGWACTYEKDVLTSEAGCYFLGFGSIACTSASGGSCNNNYHASQFFNLCSGCSGGGGGHGGGGLEDFNNTEGCSDDSECDFGYFCDWSTSSCSEL